MAGRGVTYSVKECFYTLQGEGAQTGRAAVFLRFAGCNLWSGLERDRADAVCRFCDTDFVGVDGEGGGKFADADALAAHVAARWGGASGKPYVVCTGGEPLLQLDAALIAALHACGFEVAVETNGTIEAPASLDWVCVSPKSTAQLRHSGLALPDWSASPAVASRPVASHPVASHPVASRPVASRPVASRPVASRSMAPQALPQKARPWAFPARARWPPVARGLLSPPR